MKETAVHPKDFRHINGGRAYTIPAHMCLPLWLYLTEGRPTGGFLKAILSNQLCEAISRADGDNLEMLPAYVFYLHWNAPPSAYGSPENVKAWLHMHNDRRRKEAGMQS